MKQLHHNGVMVPQKYQRKGLRVEIRGETITLSEKQEEIAFAWVKKIGTPYVEDPVFEKNFHKDFSKKLGIEVFPGEIDFSEILKIVEEEREWKENLTKEERKTLSEQRKTIRESNKNKYGWAIVDGVYMEIGNYAVEPNSIFMGRGKHPMRGRWKEGPRKEDIELNLSPDATKPLGNWKTIIWEPNSMWIARWRDKLNSKMKYVWLHDSTPLKQKKDIEKFDKALELRKSIYEVKRYIAENLKHDDIRRRKIATVTFLIDHCKFRVGDEKDEGEEADTIGASTLRPEHLNFNGDGSVTFDFLGKDSVQHYLCVIMPDQVIRNLKEFSSDPNLPLFEGTNSQRVSEFLDEVMTGLSAKVFRTYYASTAVEDKLISIKIDLDDPDYVKKHIATMANLEAARVCNHKRTIPKTWESILQKRKARVKARHLKAKENEKKIKQRIIEAEKKYKEKLEKHEQKLYNQKNKLNEYLEQQEKKKELGKSTKGLENRILSKKKTIKTQKERIKKLKNTHMIKMKKKKDQLSNRKIRDKQAIEKIKLQIKTQEETRDYNLNTSLKSYIDPRIYFKWSEEVNYDWKKYYPKTLQRKFSWVEPKTEAMFE